MKEVVEGEVQLIRDDRVDRGPHFGGRVRWEPAFDHRVLLGRSGEAGGKGPEPAPEARDVERGLQDLRPRVPRRPEERPEHGIEVVEESALHVRAEVADYEQSVSALLAAKPWVEHRGEPRLKNMLLLNIASNLCHVSRYGEAAELIEEVRRSPAGLGKIDLARISWLEGRILAGLGNPRDALRLLAEARQKFAAKSMSYDVALALLEEAGLLLAEGCTGEVKVLALELAKLFEAKGVHPEALNALRLFEEAVRQEKATIDLARRVLGFLFKARHDEGLRFES